MMKINKNIYVAALNLEINDNIARITSKIDDKICEVWKIDKKDIVEALNFKNNLIKYLENKMKECENTIELLDGTNSHRISILQVEIKNYQDLVERVKSDKNE